MNEIGKVSIKLVADTSSFFSDIKKAISQLENQKPKVSISADVSALQSSITKALSSISQLKSTTIGINADNSSATKKIQDTSSEISKIGNQSVPISVDNVKSLDKVDQVRARLDILQTRANEISINPKVNDSQLKSLELQIASTKSKLETLDPSFLSSGFTRIQGVGSAAFDTIRSSVSQTTEAIKNVTIGLGLATGAAFGIAVKGAIDYGGELQQNKGDLEVLLGSNEKALAVLKEQQKFGAQTPFETGDLIKAATNLSTVIKDVDVLNLRTKQLGEVTGGIPANLSRITNTYSQVVSKGKADTVDLKEFINSGFSQIRTEAQKELGLTGEAFDTAVSDGLLTTELLDKVLGRVTDGFPRLAKASQTLPGLFSTATDTVKNFGLSLIGIDTSTFELKTGGIAKTISDLLNKFNSTDVVESLARFGETIGSTVAGLFSNIDFGKIDLGGIVDSITLGFTVVIDAVKSFSSIITSTFDTISKSVGGLENLANILKFTAVALGVLTAAVVVFNVASSPLLLFPLAIAGGITLLASVLGNGDIEKGLSIISDGFNDLFGNIKGIFENVMKAVSPFIETVVSLYSEISNNSFVIDAINSLEDIFLSVFGIITTTVMNVAKQFSFIWNDLGVGNVVIERIKVLFIAFGAIIYGVIKAIQGIVNILEFLATEGTKNIDNLIKGFKDFQKGVGDAVKFFTDFQKSSEKTLSESAGNINKWSNSTADNFNKWANSVGDTFNKWGTQIGNTIKNKVSEFAGVFLNFAKNALQTFTNFWNSLSGSTASKLGQIVGMFLKWEVDIIISVVKFVGDFLKNITDFFSKIPGVIGGYLTSAYTTITTKFSEMQTAAIQFGFDIVANITRYLIDLPTSMSNLMNSTLITFSSFISSFVTAATSIGSGILNNIVSFIANLPANITNTFNSAISTITSFIGVFLENARAIGGSIIGGISEFVGGIPQKIADVMNGGLNTLTEFGTKFYQKAISIGRSIIDGIVAGIKQVGSNVGNAVGGFTGGVGGVFNNAAGAVNDFAGGLLKSFKFAEGGVVPKYFASGGSAKGTDTVPAYLTPGEMVINKDSSTRFSGILDSINNTPDKFGQYIRDIGRLGNTTNVSSVNKNNNINVNIGTIQGPTNQIQKNVNNIGFLLQSELLNRGIL